MMGAILHTINIRLSEQQILYTINHADDDILIVHHDFIQVIDKIRKKFQDQLRSFFLIVRNIISVITILIFMKT